MKKPEAGNVVRRSSRGGIHMHFIDPKYDFQSRIFFVKQDVAKNETMDQKDSLWLKSMQLHCIIQFHFSPFLHCTNS